MSNKVTYGLKNVHFAPITVDSDTGEVTYETPEKMLGAVELSLEARGDMVEFYADDMLFYSAQNNQGYEGTLSISQIPEKFSTDVLGEEKDEDDAVITEKLTAQGSPFALMFEFQGDKKAIRHVLYHCTANRPTVSSTSKTDSVEPNANELTFIASGRESDGYVKTRTTTNTSSTIYDAWFDEVYEKDESA
ncbi:major tail protein [Halobacillus sp. A5]|uniref:major tail protein n=1 Tax=Halobacillus sp. A5 TaxID=2880263 RepID=UPI0020A6BE69|nr:major tail protein [Halobacillus sp. A5]MCP3025416.1 phage tail protein [Halobacillus sp. A5]